MMTEKIKAIHPCIQSLRPRVSFHALRKGSLTAEAAIAFPIFFLTVICIVSIMNVYGNVVDRASSLRDMTEAAAVAAAAAGSEEERWIDITVPEYFKPFFLPDVLRGVLIPVRGRARVWNGRSESEAESSAGKKEKYVYMTANGSVYHTRSQCTHLELSTRSVSAASVQALRNSSGARYKPCEKCCRHGTSSPVVYITDDGDRYHSSCECSGLKRTVRLVPESSVEGLCECSRCAAARAAG